MMSMNLYRSKRRSSRVVRSISVPSNLPEAASEFMQQVVATPKAQHLSRSSSSMESTAIPEDREGFVSTGPMPSTAHHESLRSEESEDFFLPFDDEESETSTAHASPPQTSRIHAAKRRQGTRTTQQQQQQQYQQQHREQAMATLQEFFFLEPSSSSREIQSSPSSVVDFATASQSNKSSRNHSSKTTSSSPYRNMFGQPMYEQIEVVPSPEAAPSMLLEMEEASQIPPAAVATTRGQSKEFTLLSPADRTFSLPTEYMTSPTARLDTPHHHAPLSRKSSLKKISSYGNLSVKAASSSNAGDESLSRNVSFSNLQIREYKAALSDNPSCSYGPPVQLSWDYGNQERVISLHEYEEQREPRREPHEMLLSYYERRVILLRKAGYTKGDLKAAMKEVDRVKRERQVTGLFLAASPLDETMEFVVQKVKDFFGNKQDEI